MTEGNRQVRELPKGWCWAKISDLAIVHLGKTPKKSSYVNHGKYKIVKFRDINYSGIEWFNSQQGFVHSDNTQDLRELFEDDVLITSSAHSSDHIGKKITFVSKIPESFEKVFFVGELLNIRPNRNLLITKFIFFYFLSRLGYLTIQAKVKGVHLTSGEARKIDFPLVPLNEQQRIVEKIEELFSDLDQGIESLKTAQKHLKVYRQAVLKWAFEGKLTQKWRSQIQQEKLDIKTGEELLAQIKTERENRYQQHLAEWEEAVKEWEVVGKPGKKPTKPQKPRELPPLSEEVIAELPETPHGWCWGCSGELFMFVTSGSRGWAQYYSDSGAIFIRITNLDFNSLNLDLSPRTIQYVNLPNETEGMRAKVQENDFLFSITGYLGMFAIVTQNLSEAYINQHIALARPCKNLNYKYLGYYFIAESGGIRQFKEKQKGATKAGLALDDIQTVKTPIPPLEEQERIVQEIESRLSICDQLEATIIENLQKAEALRQSILKQAFEGKLVPQDPNDEPVEKLLERIKQEKIKVKKREQLSIQGI